MIWKDFKEKLSESAIKKFAETYHLAYVIAPLFALIISFFLETDKLFLEFVFILLSLCFNFGILWLSAKYTERKFEEEENDQISLFYTFFYDALKPPKKNSSGKDQGKEKKQEEIVFDIDIAVIEAQNEKSDIEIAYYLNDLIKKFEEDPEKKHKRVTNKVAGLTFKKLHCNPYSKDKNIIKSPKQLKTRLSDVEAVVVVRTKELDDIEWVYKTVDSWAYDHSEVPILFAMDSNIALEENKIAGRFKQISNDPKSLPWYLLKRANDRGKNWRTQATFNRALAWNIAFSILLLIYFGLYSINSYSKEIQKLETEQEFQKSKEDTDILARGFNHISETKEEFQDKIIKYSVNQILKENIDQSKINKMITNAGINVYISYWFNYENEPNIFVTTEADGTNDKFPLDTKSIIGCGFVNKNRIVDWSRHNENKTKANVWKFDKSWDEKTNCEMTELENSPIDNIVCASYRDHNYPNEPIGICIFTKLNQGYSSEQTKILFEEETRMFLYEKCKKLFADFREEVINKKIVPKFKRRLEKVENQATH